VASLCASGSRHLLKISLRKIFREVVAVAEGMTLVVITTEEETETEITESRSSSPQGGISCPVDAAVVRSGTLAETVATAISRQAVAGIETELLVVVLCAVVVVGSSSGTATARARGVHGVTTWAAGQTETGNNNLHAIAILPA
jgi:hypothetical protein